MTSTVSHETARLLAAAGFPQPAPAPGQWWGDDGKIIFVIKTWVSGGREYFAVLTKVENTDIPVIDFYFDASDFTWLVYLPTVGDILNDLGGKYFLCAEDYGFDILIEIDARINEGEKFVTYSIKTEFSTNDNPAEAAALAWISSNGNPADLDEF